MFYKVVKGKDKGAVFIAIEETEINVQSQEGKYYNLNEIKKLTEKEISQCIKYEPIN